MSFAEIRQTFPQLASSTNERDTSAMRGTTRDFLVRLLLSLTPDRMMPINRYKNIEYTQYVQCLYSI